MALEREGGGGLAIVTSADVRTDPRVTGRPTASGDQKCCSAGHGVQLSAAPTVLGLRVCSLSSAFTTLPLLVLWREELRAALGKKQRALC